MSNTIKKTDRKNKTNQIVNWPGKDSYFTIKSLISINPDFKEITLRVRLKTEIEEGRIVELGTIHGGHGRPQLALAISPVTQEAIESAKKSDILLKDCYNTVNVMEITNKSKSDKTTTTDNIVDLKTKLVNA
jgi:hypothetical protein